MKKLFFAFVLAALSTAAKAQYTATSVNTQSVTKQIDKIAVDGSGNTIITGNFKTTLTLGTVTLTNSFPADGYWFGGNSAFVAKQAGNGSYAWVKKIAANSIGSEVMVEKVVTDASGNVYVTGNYWGSVSFDNITLVSSGRDMFTLKMSYSGSVLWVKSAGTNEFWETGNSLAVDDSGYVYATGIIIDKAVKQCNGTRDFFYVVKYTSAGVKVWEKKYTVTTNSCNGGTQGTDIVTDGSNVYVTGSFVGTVNFGGSYTFNGGTLGHTVLLKLNASGNTIWARDIPSNRVSSVGDGCYLTLNNGNQDIYLSGGMTGTVSFGSFSLTSVNNNNLYLAKYATATGTCSWAVIAGGRGAARSFRFPNSNIGMMVIDSGAVTFGFREFSTAGVILSTTIAVLDSGTKVYPRDVISTDNGFMLAQNIRGSYTIDGTNITSIAQLGTSFRDMILLCYTVPPPPAPAPQLTIATTGNELGLVYPNPVKDKLFIKNNKTEPIGLVVIYDQAGRKVKVQNIAAAQGEVDVHMLPAGLYFLTAEHRDGVIKLIKE